MNSTIHLKGIDKQLVVKRHEARKIKEIWEDKSIPFDFVISIANISFPKSQIKLVIEESDVSSHDANDQDLKKFYEDERKRRDILVKQTPEQKAKRLDMFSYLYKFASNVDADEQVLKSAFGIQLSFFTEKTDRTLCDVYLLLPLIPKRNVRPNGWENGYFRFVERAVFRDMQLCGQLSSSYIPKPIKQAQSDETIIEAKKRIDENRQSDIEFQSVIADAVSKL